MRQKDINFAKVAESFGFKYTARVCGKQFLKEELKKALSIHGPTFLEVLADREEVLYPRVPAGRGYKDMILGPYIKGRI